VCVCVFVIDVAGESPGGKFHLTPEEKLNCRRPNCPSELLIG